MVAVEPGHAQTGLGCTADADYYSEPRAAANARATGFGHSAGYNSGAAHGHAFD